jgi:hypothetical protein
MIEAGRSLSRVATDGHDRKRLLGLCFRVVKVLILS